MLAHTGQTHFTKFNTLPENTLLFPKTHYILWKTHYTSREHITLSKVTLHFPKIFCRKRITISETHCNFRKHFSIWDNTLEFHLLSFEQITASIEGRCFTSLDSECTLNDVFENKEQLLLLAPSLWGSCPLAWVSTLTEQFCFFSLHVSYTYIMLTLAEVGGGGVWWHSYGKDSRPRPSNSCKCEETPFLENVITF